MLLIFRKGVKQLFCAFVLLLPCYVVGAQSNNVSVKDTLRAIFSLPESEIDLAVTKVTIDRLVDPTIDTNKVLSEINTMVKALKSGLAPDLMPMDKVLSLGAFLYESGYWNKTSLLSMIFPTL